MEEVKKPGVIDNWMKKHILLYKGATRHPFIISIRNGHVETSAFKTWLGQDYMFVRDFSPFVASVMIKASKKSDDKSDMEVILGGLVSLNDEIEWFKREASKWDVPLSDTPPLKHTQQYCRYLESLMLPEVEYGVAIAAFWAIETVYQESFAHCLEDGNKTPSELQEACQRWGSKGFGEYCRTLKKIANRCLEKASGEVLKNAEVAFLRVLELEVDFWNMSQGTGLA